MENVVLNDIDSSYVVLRLAMLPKSFGGTNCITLKKISITFTKFPRALLALSHQLCSDRLSYFWIKSCY